MFVVNKPYFFFTQFKGMFHQPLILSQFFLSCTSRTLCCLRINVIITISFTTEYHEPWIFNVPSGIQRESVLQEQSTKPPHFGKSKGKGGIYSLNTPVGQSCLRENWPQHRCETKQVLQGFIQQNEISLFKQWDSLQGLICLFSLLADARALHYPQSFISFGEQCQQHSLAAWKTYRAR